MRQLSRPQNGVACRLVAILGNDRILTLIRAYIVALSLLRRFTIVARPALMTYLFKCSAHVSLLFFRTASGYIGSSVRSAQEALPYSPS